jgi:hypothetical protein
VAPVIGSWRHRGFLDDWTAYNYQGFEAKPGWPEAQRLFQTLDRLPPGRVMWEYNKDYERFGTPRTLENIPAWTRQPTMEGLLIESSLNAPFHFINQAETSVTQTQAVPGIDYPGFDFNAGLRHLRLFGVSYYVAYDACQPDPDKQPQDWVPCEQLGKQDEEMQAAEAAKLRVVARSGRFTVYRIGDGHLVEVPRYRPVLFDHPDWRANALNWYRNPDWLATPLAFASKQDPAARRAFADPGPLPATSLPREPLHHPGTVASTTSRTGDVISFTTDRVGEPHVVKVSWFPNWHAEGAEGPWMLSPGLMVVVPTQPHVRLVYRDTPVDLAGKALTVGGLGLLAVPTVRRLRARHRQQL